MSSLKERIPPHNTEAEESVIGAAMMSKEALRDVMETVSSDDFYHKNHREIFLAIASLNAQGIEVDTLTVADELKKRSILEAVGGRSKIASLTSVTPSIYNAKEYAKIIHEKAILRKLIESSDKISTKSYTESEEPMDILDFAEKEIFNIAKSKQSHDIAQLSDILVTNLMEIQERAQNKGKVVGISSGLIDLDKKLTGFKKSDMVVLAARPSMGKTAFCLNIAHHAAIKEDATVLIFSLEMSKEQLSQRILSMEARIESQKMSGGDINSVEDWDRLAAAVNNLSRGSILIDDTPGTTMMEIKNKCRKTKAERGLDMIIIDYLQLMEGDSKSENRQQAISNLSRGMKLLAREMDCPVIVLSQLSRGPDRRENHRPVLADLRESGAIEQDADIVIFLYRDEVYNENTEEPNVCEIIVAKHRNGPIGTVKVRWDNRYTRFANLQIKSYQERE